MSDFKNGVGSKMDDQDGSGDSDLFFDFDISPEENENKEDDLKSQESKPSVEEELAWDTNNSNASIKNNGSPTQGNKPDAPLVSPDSLLEEPVQDFLFDDDDDRKNNGAVDGNESSTTGSEDEDDEGEVTFYKGDYKHTVASSKLNSLIALLEKEKGSSTSISR
jgi:hypothetical protein